MRRTVASLIALGALSATAPAGAVSLEPLGSFDQPVYVTSEPDDPDRLLVVEQEGRIQLLDHGAPSTFLDLAGAGLVLAGGERGLLSVALAPDYATSGRLYVFYTRAGDGALQIDEYTAAGNVAPLSTRRPVLTIEHPSFANHNGGQLQFGRDGLLYISTGDGGSSNDPDDNGQSLDTMLGKILRIDPRPSGAQPYSIPAGNPFADGAGPNADEIWSYGLRNPWRFSFDRLTGDLLIGDVGQAAWEEVDFDPAPNAGRAVNFGWDCREGRHTHGTSALCAGPFTDPILEYANPGSSRAAIAGGYVVRDPSLGDLYGRYVYADTYSGAIRSLVPQMPDAIPTDRSEGLTVTLPVGFGEDACGRVYLASLDDVVYRLVGDTPAVCVGAPPPPAAKRCHGREATIVAGSRTVRGTAGTDVIVGTAGRDRIRAKRGKDVICAGPGPDRVRGGGGKDRLRGAGGRDRLHGGPAADRCRGGPGRDRLRSC